MSFSLYFCLSLALAYCSIVQGKDFDQLGSSSNHQPHRYAFPPYPLKEQGHPPGHSLHLHSSKFDEGEVRLKEGNSLVEGRFKITNKDHNTVFFYSSIRANGTGSEDVAKIVELLQGYTQLPLNSPAPYTDFNDQNAQNGNNGGTSQYFPQ